GVFIETAAVLDPYDLGCSDLNMVDMVAIPERLEYAVRKAQHQDVLNSLFSEKVIDAVNLILRKHLEELRVKRFGCRQVVPEWFFDDYPPPGTVRLPGESCATELLDHRAEEPVGNSQVEQDIRRIVLPLPLLEHPSESTKSFRFREISPQIFDSLC